MKNKDADKRVKKPLYKRWWFWVIIIVILSAIFGNSGTQDSIENGINDGIDSSVIKEDQEEAQYKIDEDGAISASRANEALERVLKAGGHDISKFGVEDWITLNNARVMTDCVYKTEGAFEYPHDVVFEWNLEGIQITMELLFTDMSLAEYDIIGLAVTENGELSIVDSKTLDELFNSEK